MLSYEILVLLLLQNSFIKGEFMMSNDESHLWPVEILQHPLIPV